MKKILISLLLFFTILASFNIYFNNFNSRKETVISSTPTNNSTDIPTFEPIESKADSYAPIEIDNDTGFATSWFILNIDGNMSAESTFDKQTLTVYHGGTAFNSNQLFRDNASFINGNEYEITFDASSTMNRQIELVIMNMDTSEVLASEIYDISDQEKSYSLKFKMNNNTSWNTRVEFNLGMANCEIEHVVEISDIFVSNITTDDQNIKINQVGYDVFNQKRFVIPYNQGDMFKVINVANGEVVYKGALLNQTQNSMTGETNYYGDFTNIMEPGSYKVITQMGGTSQNFYIGQNLYKNVANDTLKFFSIQRCGQALDIEKFGNLAHDVCHNDLAIIYENPSNIIDVTGGWHDAGDYGRYVQTGAKALFDLMFAYMYNPTSFGDNIGIAESDNGIPDVLDEARYELEWLMKMQGENGEVYSKAVTPNFAEDISPEDDKQQIYVLTPETTAAGDFVSAMAMASIIYEDFDKEFSKQCLEKAQKTWKYLENTSYLVAELNPGDINAGLYRDDKDTDERFFASIAMWIATKEDAYLNKAVELFSSDQNVAKGVSYTDVGAYGAYYYLQDDDAKNNQEFYSGVLNCLLNEADVYANNAKLDGYNSSVITYGWGSNGEMLNNGIIMMFAFDITKNEIYRQMAVEQLNYIFGKNSLNMTFLVGYGTNYPHNPHSRLAKSKQVEFKGALVGGPNSNREDTVSSQISWDVPPAKVYMDEYQCYSTNEVSIYWNSALLNLMAQLDLF